MERVQVLDEGSDVVSQCSEHLVVTILKAVGEEILPEELQDNGERNICKGPCLLETYTCT
jgi:hypothetical protein